jgi:FF domain
MQKQVHDFRQLLSEVITTDVASKVNAEGKNVFNSWSEAKRLLQSDVRYLKLSSKDSESLWRRYVEDMARKIKNVLGDLKEKPERDSGLVTEERPDRDHRNDSPERQRSERDHWRDLKERERSGRDYKRDSKERERSDRDYRRDTKEERSERDQRRERKESERSDRDSRRGHGSSDYSRRR